MATQQIQKSKILFRPPIAFTVNDAVPAEVFSRYVANGDPFTFTPELKTVETELSDASELDDIVAIRAVIEWNIEELDQTDMDAINNNGAQIVLASDKGGANGTGKTLTMDNLDFIRAYPAEGWGTIIRVKKVVPGSSLPTLLSSLYSLSDNA